MELYGTVKKLTGSMEPYGDTNIDKDRKRNLGVCGDLVYDLLVDMIKAKEFKDRAEHSMNVIGKEADYRLKEIIGLIEDSYR